MDFTKNIGLSISQETFGQLPDGSFVSIFILKNAANCVVKIINFGAIITEMHVPDKFGISGDVCLGFENIESYQNNTAHIGGVIGRFCNRIKAGRFKLDGVLYQLDTNDGINHLHGGYIGLDKVIWDPQIFTTEDSVGLKLSYLSPDCDQGYPGNLSVNAIYELNNRNELLIKFNAITDKATPVNLTQHPYFNLACCGNILTHKLMINANFYTPFDENKIPTGELCEVAQTPLDFRCSHLIGERIEHLNSCHGHSGYDHNFVLNKPNNNEIFLAARVHEPASGRILEVFTQSPGIQFYSGDYLNGTLVGKGNTYASRSGFCLEPQYFPDSPNQENFPSVILRPGEQFTSTIMYKFSVGKCNTPI